MSDKANIYVTDNQATFYARICKAKSSIYIIIPKVFRELLKLQPGQRILVTIKKIDKQEEVRPHEVY